MRNLSKGEFKRVYRLARIHGRMVEVGLTMQSHSLTNRDDIGSVSDVWFDCVHQRSRSKNKLSLSIRFYRKTGRMLHA